MSMMRDVFKNIIRNAYTKNLTVLFYLVVSVHLNIYSQLSGREIQLSGTIADKYPVSMNLMIQNDKVIGYYSYEKFKRKILLKGVINDNTVSLIESPNYELLFEKGFVGQFSESIFKGFWVDSINNKSLTSNLKINKDSKVIFQKEVLKKQGLYESIFNSENYDGFVKLSYI